MKYPPIAVAALLLTPLHAAILHVAPTGDNTQTGMASAPLRSIQHAAELAQPGDTITVHAGVYRENINPPRGGESDVRRIIYQAALGDKVEVKRRDEKETKIADLKELYVIIR